MDIPVLMLANAASVENGLLNTQGAGWSVFTCQSFPWGVSGCLCGLIEVPADERGGEMRKLSFLVRDHDGKELGWTAEIGVAATIGDGPVVTPFAIQFAFMVPESVLVEFVVLSDGREVATTVLPVRAMA